MRIIAISDTHAQFGKILTKLPSADLLIHSGDITNCGDIEDLEQFVDEINLIKSRYQDIIVIGGNHDICLGDERKSLAEKILFDVGIKYLHDSGIESCGLKIYGSPYQPFFCDWQFNLPRGDALAAKWKLIPDDVNILITHGPPYQIMDEVYCEHVGCYDLAMRVKQLKDLKLHLFGHIHPRYGQEQIGNTLFVNASLVNDYNQIINEPIILDI